MRRGSPDSLARLGKKSDQMYSCPRDEHLPPHHGGPNEETPCTSNVHHCIEAFKEVLNWASIMPRETLDVSDSRTSDWCFFRVCFLLIRPYADDWLFSAWMLCMCLLSIFQYRLPNDPQNHKTTPPNLNIIY